MREPTASRPDAPEAWVCRSAEMSDAPALARVHVGAWRAAYAGHMPADYLAGLDPEAFRARWEDSIRAGRTALLIERDAGVAGFALFGPSRDMD